ncbi:MAG: DUF58 domain-containing protein [Rhodospirillaceae bacterium]|jgi:uncharacterized protein (DUF58 family)|nr:DUF58 domain-containing protein [Rhodospirillaceae bacterium]MBT5033293.1 DUF58 domain-containing protein [Rhodospirillaceae bacterium]MBT6220947.1 DUF58 domain-containing protein [Rhodospirillaceae bacterium]MBT6360732.1 DUF58 domain-containing protein [Rhodospirillaceae bacterium]
MARPHIDIHHRAEELAAGLPPLLVAAERVATTVSQGVHGRRRVGQGESFWQYRHYGIGDSAQLIDWRQSARSDHVYVRENEWEAAQSVWLWRDGSNSMQYRSDDALPTKRERTDLLLLAVASLLVRGGEFVALLGSGRSPSTGRATLNQLATLFDHDDTPHVSVPSYELIARYARVVMIGDFLSPLEEIKPVIEAYSTQGIRGHMVQVLDPAEEALPFEGRVRFEGMENEGGVLIGRTESVRDEYQEVLDLHNEGLKALCASAGWSFAQHRTDHAPEPALLALFMLLSQPVGS